MDYREPILAQYLAALEMLKGAITACPDTLWKDPRDHNTFSQVAYHALFFTHLYVQTSEAAFQAWSQHREEYRLTDEDQTPRGEPAARETVLEYLAFCQREVAAQVPVLDLDAPSGFDWLPFSKFELQIYSIRHIQQHAGELMERLGSRTGIEVNWVGSRSRIPQASV